MFPLKSIIRSRLSFWHLDPIITDFKTFQTNIQNLLGPIINLLDIFKATKLLLVNQFGKLTSTKEVPTNYSAGMWDRQNFEASS